MNGILNGERVWFANTYGVWAGRWDSEEQHKGIGRAYPTHVQFIPVPEIPEEYQ